MPNKVGNLHRPEPKRLTTGRLGKLKHELLSLLPAIIFFLIGFNLVALSKHVVLAQHGISYYGLAKATIGALLVAKVVALANFLPVMKHLQQRPLWSSALLQAVVYTALCMVVHELEGLVRHVASAGDVGVGLEKWRTEFEATEFIFIAVWVFSLFAVFVAFTEMIARSEFRTWRNALFANGPSDKADPLD